MEGSVLKDIWTFCGVVLPALQCFDHWPDFAGFRGLFFAGGGLRRKTHPPSQRDF